MAIYVITNRTPSRLHIPAPVGRDIAGNAQIKVNVPAAEMESSSVPTLAKRGAITIVSINDPAIPDSVEVGAVGVGRADGDFFTVGSVVRLYVDPVGGNDLNSGAQGVPKRTIQAALDSIPDGFRARVEVFVAAGEVEETYLKLRAEGLGSVFVYGAAEKVAGPWALTGNGSAITSPGGVLKQMQRSRVVSPSWGVPIDEQLHILQMDNYLEPDAAWKYGEGWMVPLASSDHETGTLVLVHGQGGDANNFHPSWSGNHILVERKTIFKSSLTVETNSALTMLRFRFTNNLVSRNGVSVVGSYVGGNLTIEKSTRSISTLSCTVSGYISLLNNSDVFLHRTVARALVIEGTYVGTLSFITRGSLLTGYGAVNVRRSHISNFDGADVEMTTPDFGFMIGSNSKFELRGRLSVEGVTNPFRVTDGSTWLYGSRAVNGQCSAPFLVEDGSKVVGLNGGANRYVVVNTTNADEQIKVGSRAAQTVASLPAHDFVNEDGSYNPASQGCRAS